MLCIFLLPPSIFIAATLYFLIWLKSVAFPRSNITPRTAGSKRIIVTGDDSPSILAMSRALRSAGHDVYVVDFERFPWTNPLRRSNAITKFIGLPSGRFVPNVTAIKTRIFHLGSLFHVSLDVNQEQPLPSLLGTILQLIESDKMELWVPCESDGPRAVLQTKDVVSKHSACQVYGLDPEAARMSQDQQRFSQYVERLGHDIQFPSATLVRSRGETHFHLSRAPKGQKYLIERKPSPLKTPFSSLSEKMEPDADTANQRNAKDPNMFPIHEQYRLLPMKTSNETYSAVAALTISQDQPWLMHPVIEGRATIATALLVNNSVCAFMVSTSSQFSTFSSAKRGKISNRQVQSRNGMRSWQRHEDARVLDSNSAIFQTLLEFTERFVRQLPKHTSAQINLQFMMTEKATSNGAVQKLWATGCDFRISSLLIEQALGFGQLEVIGGAYSCAQNGESVLFPINSSAANRPYSYATYSLPTAAYHRLWLPIRDGLLFRASPRAVFGAFAMFINQVAFWHEEVFDGQDPLPWVWTWLVQFPVEGVVDLAEHFINSLTQYSKTSAINEC
jgi:hypothetical protein